MADVWPSAVVAVSLVAGPAAVRIVDNEGAAAATDVRCVANDDTAVERRLGGEKDIAAELPQGTRVSVLEARGESVRIEYPRDGRQRRGWVRESDLESCFTSPEPSPPEPEPPSKPRPTSTFHPFGHPTGVDGGVLLKKSNYDCYHDPELKYCRWVGYCYRPTGTTSLRHKGDFFPEPSLPKGQRAEKEDYEGAYKPDLTGFDKGHMAPDAAIKVFGKDAQKETYSLANITPQYSGMNQGIWRELEDVIRTWASADDEVCVETGPVFFEDRPIDRLNGPNKLAIPHAYYAIVTQGSEPDVISFLIQNEPERRSIADVMTDAASVDVIEAATELDFLSELEDNFENRLEAVVPEELWR